MEENEGTQICPNCKRDIPSRNFTIHSVHCARNIKICSVCKEPVLQEELESHNERLHLLVPCKQCGEMARGTDMEDHVRDSCAFTMQCCRYCSLELRRRDVPAHERYCGARTERCGACGEYVMLRYRQLHLDSNHGFVRLHDDPEPSPAPRPIGVPIGTRTTFFTRTNKPVKIVKLQPNDFPRRASTAAPARGEEARAGAAERATAPDTAGAQAPATQPPASPAFRPVTVKRTNDQPQINTDVTPQDKLGEISKKLGARGGVKKRAAPRPPAPPPAPDPRRDLPYYSALQRRQQEDARRQEQTAYNLSVGLPPVLDPAAKLEKLRKMDALHNREAADAADYSGRLTGRVWRGAEEAAVGGILGHAAPATADGDDSAEAARARLADVTPMSPEEFQRRFRALRLLHDPPPPDLRTSLRELRRGLNEVTAPYSNNANTNNNNSSAHNNNIGSAARTAERVAAAGAGHLDHYWDEARGDSDAVLVPCEFCQSPMPVSALREHERVCRWGAPPVPPALSPPRDDDDDDEIPVIPCEFCTKTLPLYLISEHQELCEANLLYGD